MKLSHLLSLPGSLLRASSPAASPSEPPNMYQLTADVQITAAEGEGDGAKLPSFSMHAYTGDIATIPYYGRVVFDLSGIKFRAGRVKILREHNRERIVGHATKVEINDRGVFIEGVMSGDDAEVAAITGPSKRGFAWEASVGLMPDLFNGMAQVERLRENETATVNGKQVKGPLLIARKTTLKEVSFVTFGGDENTNTRIAATATPSGASTMTFEQWLRAHGFDPATITDGFKATMQAQYDQEKAAGTLAAAAPSTTPPAAPSPNPAPPAAPAAAPAAPAMNASADPMNFNAAMEQFRGEQVRIENIRAMCARHNNPTIKVNGADVALAAHAIEQGLTMDAVELHILRATRPGVPAAIVRDGSGNMNANAVEAALCLSAGMNSEFIAEQFDAPTMEAAESRHLRGISLHGLIRLSLQANGTYMPALSINNDVMEAALRSDPMLNGMAFQASGFSTISLSGILSNLANKAMLERFEQADAKWREIASVTSANNFKPFTRYRIDSTGAFQEVGQDGELKHIKLNESEFSNRLKTEGGMISLTRQMQIDDDLGSFLQMPQIFGELAVYALDFQSFRTLLASGFFTSGRGNYFSGAASALGVTGLSKAVELFRKAKGIGGRFAMLQPAKLVVGPALEAEAEALYTSQELRGMSAKEPTNNTHKGKYKPVVSPFLSDGAVDNATDKQWFLSVNPSASAGMIQVAFLNGRAVPVIESGQANFNVLGIQWRSYLDFGIAQFEERAGVMSKGEA